MHLMTTPPTPNELCNSHSRAEFVVVLLSSSSLSVRLSSANEMHFWQVPRAALPPLNVYERWQCSLRALAAAAVVVVAVVAVLL